MDNDSGALILLIVLIISAFLLIVIKLAQFVDHFRREKRYLLTEMNRAADYNEYRYWRRELRCLYLCLIPFVTERNVMKVYPAFLHRVKHAAKEVQKPWVSAGVLWKSPRCIRLWRIQRGDFEEVSRFPCRNVAGDRLTRRGRLSAAIGRKLPSGGKIQKRPNKKAAPPPCGGGAAFS